MGQKTNPVGLRLGIIKGWDSNWYGGKNYGTKLIEDEKIRSFLLKRVQRSGISKIYIERQLKRVIITVMTSKPGVIIGKGGAEVDKLKVEIKKIVNTDVQINISEIKKPELDSRLVAENIAQQLQNRVSFRRAMKMAVSSTLRSGALGIKVMCSGRLGGAEIARSEMYKEGRVPLQTLRADIDYSAYPAQTIYGTIGIKVWIFKKEIFGKVDLTPEIVAKDSKPSGQSGNRESGGYRNDRSDRGGDRSDRRRGGDRDRGKSNEGRS